MSPTVKVSDLVATLESAVPSAWAEPWDRVGLLAGDADAEVAGVVVALDPTPAALDRAIAVGATCLLTHHPAYLEAPEPRPAPGMAGVPFRAVASGVALVTAHTNLDRSPEGADALPAALGLEVLGPLESGLQPVDAIVTYVPPEAAETVRKALAAAGAGRIGLYEACSFSQEGEGRFTALPGASPVWEPEGGRESVREVRIEAVCARGRGEQVAAALRAAHPYDEPVILVGEGGISRGAARMGRVCTPGGARTLADLADAVGRALGVRPTVWGDPGRAVTRVGTAPGSGRSLVPFALEAGVDVLVTGELRYHESLAARDSGLAVIEAGHDATEWPMVPVLARIARRTTGLEQLVHEEPAAIAWWTTEGA